MSIKELEAGSFTTGDLPPGCGLCAKGSKMVLLTTGLCSSSCYYCPLSQAKMNNDVIFADELRVSGDSDILMEADAIEAQGSSLTGGDPILVLDRSLGFITLLKEKYGPEHHVHLYTATPIDVKQAKLLADAGLDSIRFHPPPEDWKVLPDTYKAAVKASIDVGIAVGFEVPAVPGAQDDLLSLAKQIDKLGVGYLNLNELEFSESNWEQLKEKGFEVIDDVSSAVKGSRETALEVVKNAKFKMTIHFCSSSFKDAVQLRARLIRRAENTKTPLDVVTEEGMFIRGVIETRDIKEAVDLLRDEYEVPDDLFWVEDQRILIAPWVLEEIAEELDWDCYIVEEYPTSDRLEVERTKL